MITTRRMLMLYACLVIREKDARQNDIIRLQRPNGALVMQNLQGKESP